MSEETSQTLRGYLKNVVDYGTGGYLKIAGYSVGGKTGAAEKQPRDKQHYVTSFIGFMPAEEPQVVFYVVLDEAQVADFDTSRAAQELARDIMIELIPYLEIYPVDESYEINVGGLPTPTQSQPESSAEYVTDENGETVTDAEGNPETVEATEPPTQAPEQESTQPSGEAPADEASQPSTEEPAQPPAQEQLDEPAESSMENQTEAPT